MHLCKTPRSIKQSPLKYFEYTALGLPAIFSNILPYKGVVEDGKTGLLASSSEVWLEKLSKLVESPGLRQKILQNAQEDVNQNYWLSNHTDEWRRLYNDVLERGVDGKSDRAINIDLLNRISHHVGVAANYQAHQISTCVQKNEALSHDLYALKNVLYELELERVALGSEIDALNVALHNSELEVVDYATSTSWKITRPIRRVLRKLRRS